MNFFFELGFTPCTTEQSLRGMQLQDKEPQKDYLSIYINIHIYLSKMLLFGLVFVLFYIQLSCSSGFWKSLQTTDRALHKVAVLYQKSLLKLEKAKLDINSLNRCKDTNAFPKLDGGTLSIKHCI